MRVALFQTANQREVVLERQVRMQAADDVKFRGAFGDAVTGTLIDFFERKVVGAGCIGRTAKGAEFAVRDADVGGVDVAIDVEIGDVAVAFFRGRNLRASLRRANRAIRRARGRRQR